MCNLRYLILTLAQIPQTYKVPAVCASNLHLTMLNIKLEGTLKPSNILVIKIININYASSLQSSILTK